MNKKRFIAISLAMILLALAFAGCGEDPYADSPYVGEWKAGVCEYMGLSLDASVVIEGGFTITLEASGKATATIGGDSSGGKWEPTDDGVRLYDLGDELFFTADGDDLVVEYSGMTITFAR